MPGFWSFLLVASRNIGLPIEYGSPGGLWPGGGPANPGAALFRAFARPFSGIRLPGGAEHRPADGQTTDSGSSFLPVGPIWISVPIVGQTPQS
ncbi:hypothetical protein GCM10009546_24170 [Actinomadura livida]|uniref:Uncharacterized protein n=1 Tax=Actinomadura livida TaxID=79909 RepID=A0ABN1E890_9ACTN|nr:hypothetical protein GCM10010208_39690 [Actinomadura livida]